VFVGGLRWRGLRYGVRVVYQERRIEGNGLGGEQTRRQGGVNAGGSSFR